MESDSINIGSISIPLHSQKPEKVEKTERSITGKIKDFFQRNVFEKDEETGDYKVNKKMYVVAAAEVAVGGGIGYKIGAEHQARDIVTQETIMKDVMKTVKVGERMVTGGFHYHYDFASGEWEYGYDPFWVHTEPVYEQVPTGEKVPVTLTHHTEKFPYTALQGFLTGALIGGFCGVVTLAIAKILAMNR